MSIFNSKTLTELAQGFTKADSSLTKNYKGSAPLDGTITNDDWLPSTKGADCKLVHGDRQEHIAGNMQTVIDQDSTKKVQGKESYNVTKNQARIIGGDLLEIVSGHADIFMMKGRTLDVFTKDEYSVFGSRDVTVTGLDTETYLEHREIDEPWKFETVPFDTAYKTVIVEICNIKTEACIGVHIDVQTLHIAAELLEDTSKALTLRLKALDNRILAIGSKIGGLDMKLAARINGAPTESVTAPIAGA